MEEKKITVLAPELEKMIRNFLESQGSGASLQRDNDRVIGSAFVYEKIRSSLEYQEDHLIFKNAIARILRRKYTLNLNPKAPDIVTDLINELSWANYINPEGIAKDQSETMVKIVDRYLIFLKNVRSGHITKNNLQKMVIGWMACEIDEIFHPTKDRDIYLDYVATTLLQNILLEKGKEVSVESLIQLKIAIYTLVLKPDYYLLQYWLIETIYPDWTAMSPDDLIKIARSFDPYYNKVNNTLNFSDRKKYLQFVKMNIAPFILLYRLLVTEKTCPEQGRGIDLAKIKEKPQILHTRMMETYNLAVREARNKVWRGTYRALVFILITKISLAFIIEIPFDRLTAGSVNYSTLLINIILPPALMLIAGTFVKSPGPKNYAVISESITNLISHNQIGDKKFSLAKRKNSSTNRIFNFIYLLFTLAILAGTIWLLIWLGFNFISITLFFLFVSAVSFFSFRIRNIALELAMKRARDDALTSTLEFIFLPFIRMGRYLSDRIAAFNPFILALDFLIEAPLKSILKITNLWFKFINTKKEDLEL